MQEEVMMVKRLRLFRGTTEKVLVDALKVGRISGLWSGDKIYPVYWVSSHYNTMEYKPVVLEARIPKNLIYDMRKTEGIGVPWFEPKQKGRIIDTSFITAVWIWNRKRISEKLLRDSVGLKKSHWKRVKISKFKRDYNASTYRT
jgi:hypothetical protein